MLDIEKNDVCYAFQNMLQVKIDFLQRSGKLKYNHPNFQANTILVDQTVDRGRSLE